MKTKSPQHRVAIFRIITLTILVASLGLRAQTNSWINPASGKWENTNYWSLNALPSSSQTIEITNNGTKVVTVDQATLQAAATSMTVASIELSANNTLLLTNFGTNVPFHVLGSIAVY